MVFIAVLRLFNLIMPIPANLAKAIGALSGFMLIRMSLPLWSPSLKPCTALNGFVLLTNHRLVELMFAHVKFHPGHKFIWLPRVVFDVTAWVAIQRKETLQ